MNGICLATFAENRLSRAMVRIQARRGHELDQGACRAGGKKQPHSDYILKSMPAGCPDGLEVKRERKRVKGDGQGLHPNTWKDGAGTS